MEEKKVEIGALALEAQFTERAKLQFQKLMKKNIKWVAEKCWPENLKSYIRDFNKIIGAAKKLGVTNALLLEETEVDELAEKLAPLGALEMSDDIYVIVISKLESKGVPREIFFEERTETKK